jgi:NAD(P)-dependent dehydrogenase (short-subunit alcohol dehydrogenase family)
LSSKLFSLEGRVIAITGGYGWLGASIAKGLVSHGGRVFVLGRSRDKFNATFQGQYIDFLECDVERAASVEAAFSIIASTTGRLNVVINNAFYCRGADPTAISDEDWSYSLDGTLGTVHRGIRAAIPYLRRHDDSRIVNVSSIYGLVSPSFSIYDNFPKQLNPPHYGAGKAAVIQLTRYYAALLGPDGINVNCVTPGPFPSEKIRSDTDFVSALSKKTPLQRIGHPDELQGAFVFLSSRASSYVTGHNLVVDGGWTAW